MYSCWSALIKLPSSFSFCQCKLHQFSRERTRQS
uniref:Uncharacterized protein n=1 Tax=Arundo donax TaxID=35708 RepID=A0A0A8YLD6_ARUDO